jgi:hypothetical protein
MVFDLCVLHTDINSAQCKIEKEDGVFKFTITELCFFEDELYFEK